MAVVVITRQSEEKKDKELSENTHNRHFNNHNNRDTDIDTIQSILVSIHTLHTVGGGEGSDGGYQRRCWSSKIRIPTRWRRWSWQESSSAESEARGVAGHLQRPHSRGKLLSFSLCSSVVRILFTISLLSLRLYILVFGEIVWWEYELDDYVCQYFIHVLRFLILAWCILWWCMKLECS